MAMTLLNDSSVALSLGQLNKNINKVGKSLAKLSTGQRITGASVDTASFAISEKMREQLRSLEQDIQNVQNGSAMLKTAHGGIENIVEELRSLKELAINAANDSNTDADRAIIQKEFDKRRDTIDDIATWTNYNTKPLLDGSYGTKISSTYTTVPVYQSKPVDPVVSLGSGTGDYSIESNGVYVLNNGYTGTLTIAEGVEKVTLKQADSSTALKNVYVVAPNSGVNLWIENLNISNSQDNSAIRFQGGNNLLWLSSNNKITSSIEATTAIINIGGGLTIEDYNGGQLEFITNPNLKPTSTQSGLIRDGAAIGTDGAEKSKANLTINGGSIVCKNLNGGCAIIGSGTGGSIGDININGGTFDIYTRGGGACIGSGEGGSAGNITIRNANIKASADDGACIGSGCSANVGNITILNSIVEVHNVNSYFHDSSGYNSGSGAGIGSGYLNSKAGNITIRGSNIIATSRLGEDIGAGVKSTVGNGETVDIGKSLTIHHGTRANQAINFYINDMRSEALGINLAKVTTRPNATSAISIIDGAISYALDEATHVGAYLQRLEYTESNVVTTEENIQGAESTICDADMAKEMTEYTKFNVLSQAAQSMLAQVNQNMSGVLSLLQ